MACIVLFSSCDNDRGKDESNTYIKETTTHETTVPAAQPEPKVRDSVTPDGTTIRVNEEGIDIRSKNDDRESNVNISSDSADVRIRVPD